MMTDMSIYLGEYPILVSILALNEFSPELTHLSRMKFPISIGRASLLQILGVLCAVVFIQILLECSVNKQWRP